MIVIVAVQVGIILVLLVSHMGGVRYNELANRSNVLQAKITRYKWDTWGEERMNEEDQ